MKFTLLSKDPACGARRGRLEFERGVVETPAFLPVGTQGPVKAVTPDQLRSTGTRMVLANTYHLALRPGSDVVREAGGVARFTGWNGPTLTDSGGYQVFSLAHRRRLDDDGVTFRSHIDGERIRLTPERSIEIQNDLGADIIMAFDECLPWPSPEAAVERAVERTTRWAARCREAHRRDGDQALFGIVQGGGYEPLRRRSAAELVSLDLPGYAIGGVSVGEPPEEMRRAVRTTAPLLPADRPRYLMGVGTPEDLIDMVVLGVDLFDCVIPTRHARNATLFTSQGDVHIRNSCHKRDLRPLDPDCDCLTCRQFSRAFLRHIYLRGEILASTLGTIHNLAYYQRLVSDLRQAIEAGDTLGLQARRRRGAEAAGPDGEKG